MDNKDRKRTYAWINPLETADKIKNLTGLEFLNGLLEKKIPNPPIADTLEFYLSSVDDNKIVFDFVPQEFHYNPIGTVHGGVITTVLDTVMGCAIHSVLSRGVGYSTLELKINFLRAVTYKCGVMKAEGRIIHSGKTTALIEADLRDEAGKLYAHGTSTYMIFKP